MGFMASDNLTRTPQWADDIIRLLGLQEEDESEEEEECEEVSAPFKVNLTGAIQRSLGLRDTIDNPPVQSKKRKRVYGVRRKTLMEVKTEVIGKMNLNQQVVQKQVEKKVSKLLFITKAKITVLNSRDFKHEFYELTDTQFNLYTKLVKEEVERDKLDVENKKKELLLDLNRLLVIQNGRIILRN